MIVLKRRRYYTRGTPEYNKRFAHKIFYRAFKKFFLKMIKAVIILGAIFAFIYWTIIVVKAQMF